MSRDTDELARMKGPMQMLHQTLHFSDDPDYHDSYMMRDYHRPSLDSISENNDDNNNRNGKNCSNSSLVGAPSITITGCDVENGNGSETRSLHSLTGSDSDLSRLKLTATRLRLGTRRASYVEWREQYLERPRRRPKPDLRTDFDLNGNDSDKLTDERKERINDALEWLRSELVSPLRWI